MKGRIMSKTTISKTVLALNDMDNLRRKTKKTTGERRRTPNDTVADEVSSQLSAAETPSEMAQIAMEWGLSEDEVVGIATRAPNWGQFRMVVGNRLRGVQQRLAEFDGDRAKAAYPREARKAARDAAKAARDAAKAAAPAKAPKAPVAPKVTKKTSKKTGGKKRQRFQIVEDAA